MNKSPEAFRTISEVAEALTVPPHVLRFWETRFPQVKPVKRGGGRRYYRPEDVRLLRGIRGLLYDDGITIKGVQKILRERGVRHVISLGTRVDGAEEDEAETPAAVFPDAPPAEVTEAAGTRAPLPGAMGRDEPLEAHAPGLELAADLAGAGAEPAKTASLPESGTQEDSPLIENEAPATNPDDLAQAIEDEAPIRRPEAMDRAALRNLLEKLEALRGTMTAPTGK